jgi:MarR family transcriptional regulator, transcriptional regulator for hemolysin
MGMHTPPAAAIGLQVINAAQLVSDALDVALTTAGGTLVMWRILAAASGKDQWHGAHSEFSESMGFGANTLADDVRRMEVAGLVVRTPDPQHSHDRRLELTEAGRALFHRLLRAVVAFDTRLRTGLAANDIEVFSSTLTRLGSNAAPPEPT